MANVGPTDPNSILDRIKRDASAGIQLVTVGVGMGNYNDVLLEQLADQGDGFYAYVDTLDEARRLFVDDLTSTLDTVALDAKVQVDFDPASSRSTGSSGSRTGTYPTTSSATTTWPPARSVPVTR